jgi:hypothetical protein
MSLSPSPSINSRTSRTSRHPTSSTTSGTRGFSLPASSGTHYTHSDSKSVTCRVDGHSFESLSVLPPFHFQVPEHIVYSAFFSKHMQFQRSYSSMWAFAARCTSSRAKTLHPPVATMATSMPTTIAPSPSSSTPTRLLPSEFVPAPTAQNLHLQSCTSKIDKSCMTSAGSYASTCTITWPSVGAHVLKHTACATSELIQAHGPCITLRCCGL